MVLDTELHRLGELKNVAFEHRQATIDSLMAATRLLEDARYVLGSAQNAWQQVLEEHERAWQQLQRLRSTRKVKPGALQQAWRDYESVERVHRTVKGDLIAAKSYFEATRKDYQRALAEFNVAKEEFEYLRSAVRDRAAIVRAQAQWPLEEEAEVARRAGVPTKYHEQMYIVVDMDGRTQIYFGGEGEPLGPGHGHYVLDGSGVLIYSRDPGDAHGPHNFSKRQVSQKGADPQ